MYHLSFIFSDEEDRNSFEFNVPLLKTSSFKTKKMIRMMKTQIIMIVKNSVQYHHHSLRIFVPNVLPVPATSTPVLPAPSKKKQRGITNQEVLKLQAEVLQHQKEVLILKKENMKLKN